MATYSTGITATWGGVSFAQVFDLGVSLYGNVRQDRATSATSQGWSDSPGTITVSAYGTANMAVSEYGTRKTLSLAGGGFSLTVNAVCIGVDVTPQLNSVTKYNFTAQILE